MLRSFGLRAWAAMASEKVEQIAQLHEYVLAWIEFEALMPSKPFEAAYEAAKANNFKPMKEFIKSVNAGFDTVERVLQNIQHLVEQSRDAGWMLSVPVATISELTDIFRVIRTDAGLLTAAKTRDSWSATPPHHDQ